MRKKETLLLLDTSALVFRSYHALPPLTAPDGMVVNAVYGVASTLLAVLKEYAPDYVIAAYDEGGVTFRHKAYEAYKAHRAAMPDDLRAQLPLVRALIDAMGIPGVSHAGFEADDVIGTIARDVVAKQSAVHVVIVTGDADALQLVDARITVHTFGRGMKDAKVYDVAAVRAKYGIAPSQLADYKGLAGDSSDNIPGVRGVGAKTATKLIAQYGSLEGVYAHIDEQKGALKARLLRDKAQAFLSRDLGRIATDVPVTYDLQAARVQLDTPALRSFLQRMGFFSLMKRLPQRDARVATDTSAHVVVHGDAVATLRAIRAAECVAVVPAHSGAALDGFALALHDGMVRYVPAHTAAGKEVAAFLADTRRTTRIVMCDVKAWMHRLRAHDIILAAPYTDILLQAYVTGVHGALSLADLVERTLGETMPVSQPALVADPQAAMREADCIVRLTRAYDVQIDQIARTQKEDASVATLLTTIELPLVPVLAAMERMGIACDAAALAALAKDVDAQIAELEEVIHDAVGDTFNINSPRQLADALFGALQLPTNGIKKTKTGYSTAAAELAKLRDVHPIIAQIETYRELSKLKSTYIDALPKMIAADGRIHTTFQQTVTATGRLSSTDPNLQNIPTRTAHAQEIRRAFVARNGYVLLSADYSQIDLRCVAHLSRDARMIAAFAAGEDIHATTAAAVFDVAVEDVTPRQRRQAKALNFGLIYGMGAYGFAQSAGIDVAQAKDFIARYFARFSGVKAYMDATIAFAKEHGFVETPFGRRRAVPEILAKNAQVMRSGERMAINMPVQGMAADIMKMAMVAVARHMDAQYPDAALLLQVHDEVICEVPAAQAATLARDLRDIMQAITTLRVPLVVDTVWGATWADLK